MNNVPVVGAVTNLQRWSRAGLRDVSVSPDQIRTERVTTTTFSNPGVTKFTFKPNSITSIIDRNMYIEYTFSVTFTTTNPAGVGRNIPDFLAPINLGGTDAPQFMPVSQCILSTSVALNSNQISLEVQDILDLYGWIGTDDKKWSQLSMCPSARDQFQDYNPTPQGGTNVPSVQIGGEFMLVSGDLMNPLHGYGAYYGKGTPRGSIIQYRDPVGNTDGATDNNYTPGKITTFYFKTREPLVLPPFNCGEDEPGLCGLTSLDIAITFGNANRCWSRQYQSRAVAGIGGVPNNQYRGEVQNIVMAFTSPPVLILNQYTPSSLLAVPRAFFYNYANIQRYETSKIPGGAADGAISTAKSNNIILSYIPNMVVVQIKLSSSVYNNNASYPWHFTNTNQRITKLSVLYGVESTQLTSATTVDLFKWSTKYGLDMSWQQFNNTVGSICILKFGDNIPLRTPGEAPGVSMSNNFSVEVQYSNLITNAATRPYPAELAPADFWTTAPNYSIFLTTVTPGTISIIDTKVDINTNAIRQTDVTNAQIAAARNPGSAPFPSNMESDMFGAGFVGGGGDGNIGGYIGGGLLKNLGKAALAEGKKRYGEQAGKMAMTTAQKFAKMASGGSIRGGNLRGGAVMEEEELEDNINNY
jgi:hypothetical protein